MKYSLLTALALVLAVPAYAADMPAKAAALNSHASAGCQWAGLYVGTQGGYATAKVEYKGRTVFDDSNWLAGAHVGYNTCLGNLVIGIETDAMLGGWDELGWIGTTRGRIGFLASPSLLAYGTAGVAYGRLDSTLFDTSFTGWTGGAGLEYRLASHLTTRLEYRYTDLSVASFLPHLKSQGVLFGLSVGLN